MCNSKDFKGRNYIICNSKLEMKLSKELPNANSYVFDLEQYVDTEPIYYYCQLNNNNLSNIIYLKIHLGI